METLLPRDAWKKAEAPFPNWLPVWMGGLLAIVHVALGLTFLGDGRLSAALIGRGLLTGFLTGILLGVFSSVREFSSRERSRRSVAVRYGADPEFVPPVPPGDYLYRLPCDLVPARGDQITGVLYLGARGLRFDPTLDTPRRARDSIIIEPLQRARVATALQALPWLARRTGRRSVSLLAIHWGRSTAQFAVPDVDGVVARLGACIATLSQHSSHSEGVVDGAPKA